MPVAAHAHGDGGAADAIRAGAASIEHATFLSDDTIRLAKEHGTVLVPTAAIVRLLSTSDSEHIPITSRLLGKRMFPSLERVIATAHSLGVPLATGTDIGYADSNSIGIADEIDVLVDAGMPHATALAAATSVPAALLGIGGRTGRIETGLEADLVVLNGDPLSDTAAYKAVVMVINNGVIAVDKR